MITRFSWLESYRFQILFVVLLTNIILPEFFGISTRVSIVTPLLNLMLLFGSFLIIRKFRKVALYLLLIGMIGVSSTWIDGVWRILGITVLAFYFIIVAYELFNDLLTQKVIRFKEVIGALDGYLMIGFVGALVMLGINTFYEGAFSNVPSGLVGGSDLLYFSYVTLSTIGYGDIVPLIPAARGVVLMVGLFGQFYLVVVIASFVGMFIMKRNLD